MPQGLAALALLLLGAAGLSASGAATDGAPPATHVQDKAALAKLTANSGISLQWIGWTGTERGKVKARWKRKTLFLTGAQSSKDGKVRLSVEGTVRSIGKTEFILDGTIIIENTPDMGRQCSKTGEWRFAITEKRKYWRLREFEWCDGLTDYIDIYF